MSGAGSKSGGGGGKSGGTRKRSTPGNKSGATGKRTLTTRVKSAKGRRISSTRWLQRQLNDPYVEAAREEGLRSRAAFKLIQINEKHRLLKPGDCVVDLGAAPGGWSTLAAGWVKSVDGQGAKRGMVVAVDLVEIEPIAGVSFLKLDFMDDDAPERIREVLDGRPVNAVISDMAAPSTGHKQTDHLRIIGLCEAAVEFAREVLAPDGLFLAKVLQGGTTVDLLKDMKRDFARTRHLKPEASRADSSEMFVLATGFRGRG